MKKNFVPVSGFDSTLTRELKASERLFCRVYDGDDRVYVCTGYFIAVLTPAEYDELARPVFQADAGDLFMDRKNGCRAEGAEKPLDIRKLLTSAANDSIEPLHRAPFTAPAAASGGANHNEKDTFAFCYEPKSQIVSVYNKKYFDVFKAHVLKSKSAVSAAVAFAGDDAVGMLLPINLHEHPANAALIRSIKAYFTAEDTKQDAAPVVNATAAELQTRLEIKRAANKALKNDLDRVNNEFHKLEQHNAANVKALDAAKAEIEKLRAELDAAKAAAQNAAAPVETKPAPKTAAEMIAALWAKDGITTTIKGANTAAPVVWLAGVNKKQAKEVEAAGGAYSKKRDAYYFRVA